MIELYDFNVDIFWIENIISVSKKAPQHTYITLTKSPIAYCIYTFPKNWWLGVTIDHSDYHYRAMDLIRSILGHEKIFISFEPLLTPMFAVPLDGIDWVIIGGLTPKPVHKKEWIDDIVRRADAKGIPVFIKDNAHYPEVRRDFP